MAGACGPPAPPRDLVSGPAVPPGSDVIASWLSKALPVAAGLSAGTGPPAWPAPEPPATVGEPDGAFCAGVVSDVELDDGGVPCVVLLDDGLPGDVKVLLDDGLPDGGPLGVPDAVGGQLGVDDPVDPLLG